MSLELPPASSAATGAECPPRCPSSGYSQLIPAFLLGPPPRSLQGPQSHGVPRDVTQDREVLTAGVVQVGGEEDGVVRTPGEEKGKGGGHPRAGGTWWPRRPPPTDPSLAMASLQGVWVGVPLPAQAAIGPPQNHFSPSQSRQPLTTWPGRRLCGSPPTSLRNPWRPRGRSQC